MKKGTRKRKAVKAVVVPSPELTKALNSLMNDDEPSNYSVGPLPIEETMPMDVESALYGEVIPPGIMRVLDEIEQVEQSVKAVTVGQTVVIPPVEGPKVRGDFRLAICAYLPPPGRFGVNAFLANIRENPPTRPVVYFSEHPWDVPDLIKIPDPENLIKNTHARPYNVANLLWFSMYRLAAIRLADRGFSHLMPIETDCKFSRPGWDDVMAEEFLSLTPRPMIAGSISVYNAAEAPEGKAMFDGLLSKHNTRKNFPVPSWNKPGVGPCIFANGAGAIFSLDGIREMFKASELVNTSNTAGEIVAYDLEAGLRVWKRHGLNSFDLIRHLDCIFSSHGDAVSSRAERLEMLKSKVLVHQLGG